MPTASDLNEQRNLLETTFRGGWVSAPRQSRSLNNEQLSHVRGILETGGHGDAYEIEYASYIRSGGEWGSSLPAQPEARRPFVKGMGDDFEFVIVGEGEAARVAILFSHERAPGVRFGYRFPSPGPRAQHAAVFLMEEIEAGKFGKQVVRARAPGEGEIVWLDADEFT